MENYDPKEAVRLGAMLLDGGLAGWRTRIDRERLDMASACDCILGQLFGDFGDGVESVEDSMPINDLMDGTPWTVQFGFLAHESSVQWQLDERQGQIEKIEQEEQELHDLWIATIEEEA